MFAACSAVVAIWPLGVAKPYASMMSLASASPMSSNPCRRCLSTMLSTLRRLTENSRTTRLGRAFHRTYSDITYSVATALSGESYCGTPPFRRTWTPGSTLEAPRKQARTGLPFFLAIFTRASAVSLLCVIACGVSSTTAAIDIRIVQDEVEGELISVGQGVAEHVDRVVNVGCGGQLFRQFLLRLVGELGKGQAPLLDGVGRHDARPACVGDHRHSRPLGQWLVRERLGEIELLLDRFAADDAGPPERGFIRHLAAGQTARMGGRGLGAGRRAAGFHQQDRLLVRRSARPPARTHCRP